MPKEKIYKKQKNFLIKKYIDELRYQTGYSYKEIAEAIGVSVVTMSFRLHEMYNMNLEKLQIIARMLAVDFNTFYNTLLELKKQNDENLSRSALPDQVQTKACEKISS